MIGNRERGAVTLLMSLIFLALVTTITVYTSRTVFFEQKIANSDAKAKQAFEAAEAGLSTAIAYLSVDPDRNDDDAVDANVFDTDADTIGDTDTATVGTGGDAGSVQVTTSGTLTDITVTAVGYSFDKSASKTIVQSIATLDPLPNSPDNPFTTRGAVVITGSATVHNAEGHSTIWSGGDVDLGSNNSTSTEVADVTDANYPGCMDTPLTCSTIPSSNKVTAGLDIIEYDASLSNLTQDEFFENFFGMGPTAYRETMVTMETTAANANTDVPGSTDEVIWVEGDTNFNFNTTVGCESSPSGNSVCPDADIAPSIVIVNGDATFQGNPDFYGIVFITGSVTIIGNTTVYGSMVTAGSVENQTGGSLDIHYHGGALQGVSTNGPTGGSSGTWRDF